MAREPLPKRDLDKAVRKAESVLIDARLDRFWVAPRLFDDVAVSYSGRWEAATRRLELNRRCRTPTVTLLHEIGHVLKPDVPEDVMNEVLSAAPATETYQRLLDAEKSLGTRMWAYLQDDTEVFARVFAQWHVERRGNSAMRRELNITRDRNSPRQWPDGELADAFGVLDRWSVGLDT